MLVLVWRFKWDALADAAFERMGIHEEPEVSSVVVAE